MGHVSTLLTWRTAALTHGLGWFLCFRKMNRIIGRLYPYRLHAGRQGETAVQQQVTGRVALTDCVTSDLLFLNLLSGTNNACFEEHRGLNELKDRCKLLPQFQAHGQSFYTGWCCHWSGLTSRLKGASPGPRLGRFACAELPGPCPSWPLSFSA